MSAPCRQSVLVSSAVFKPAMRPAKRPHLTPLQEMELCAWYKAKCALGTWKSKALELGATEATLKMVVERRLGLR